LPRTARRGPSNAIRGRRAACTFSIPRSLGRALLDPEHCEALALADARRQQWAYSTLTETYAAILRPREFLRRFREMRSARDVIWSARDPMPFLLMTPMSWEILWPAMTTSLTLGEATQRDIAWFGGSRDRPLSCPGAGSRGSGSAPGAAS
jgi:hypothetical protein